MRPTQPSQPRFSVVCVDDDDFARHALKQMLADPMIELLALCASGQECFPIVSRHKPQVALVDMQLNGDPMGGVAVIKRIRDISPTTVCAVLTATAVNGEYFFQAWKAGAEAYYSKGYAKGVSLPMLLKCLAEKEYQLEPRFARQLAECARGYPQLEDAARKYSATLSDRERQVLDLIAEEYSNSDIAKKLVISENTVKTHKQNIINKLALGSHAQLAVYALLEKHLVSVLQSKNK